MSTVKTDAIETRAGGTSVLTIGTATQTIKLPGGTPGADKVLTSNATGEATWETSATPVSYPSDAWVFRLTTGFNGSQDPITNSWTKIQYLGADTFADPSTGVFTFPSTGIWYIRAQSSFSNNASYYQSINIKVDTGSGQSIIATGYGATRDSNEPAGIAIITAFFDVTDTSTHKCSFSISANNASMSTLGSATTNNTYIEFTKVGAT